MLNCFSNRSISEEINGSQYVHLIGSTVASPKKLKEGDDFVVVMAKGDSNLPIYGGHGACLLPFFPRGETDEENPRDERDGFSGFQIFLFLGFRFNRRGSLGSK